MAAGGPFVRPRTAQRRQPALEAECATRNVVRGGWPVLISVLLAACKGGSQDHAIPSVSPSVTATGIASASASIAPAASAGPSITVDASTTKCRVLRGPIELPLRAPASLAVRSEGVDAVLNEDGRPRLVSFPAGPILSAATVAREVSGGATPGLGVPCAIAGDRFFCIDRSGAVHRTTRAGTDDRLVASARSTARIAAATIGGAHVALAYLASRHTSEGWVSEAWLTVDDDPPLRVSEDGSGATALALAPRGPALLALTIDARTALTAMHARVIGYDKAVRLGEDAVIFVGGPGDRRTRGALAVPSAGPAWALLPIAKDVGTFGLAVVRMDDPPIVDEPVVWSMYPNGLDPAPVAATVGSGRSAAIWVARVRPQVAEPSSPRVLELGQLGVEGAFTPGEVVPTTGNVTDVAIAVDSLGALWLTWVDTSGSWLERLACR
jgi:hypothetical protein